MKINKKTFLNTSLISAVALPSIVLSCSNNKNNLNDKKVWVEHNPKTLENQLFVEWTLPDTFNLWQDVKSNDESSNNLLDVHTSKGIVKMTIGQKNVWIKNEKALANVTKKMIDNNTLWENWVNLGKMYLNSNVDYISYSTRQPNLTSERKEFIYKELGIKNNIEYNLFEAITEYSETELAYSVSKRKDLKYIWSNLDENIMFKELYRFSIYYSNNSDGGPFGEKNHSYWTTWNEGYETDSFTKQVSYGQTAFFKSLSSDRYIFYHNNTIPFPSQLESINVDGIDYYSKRGINLKW